MAGTCRSVLLSVALLGCVQAHDVDLESASPAREPDPDPAQFYEQLSADCKSQVESSLDGLPQDLDCAGLYADIGDKEVAKGLHEFEPAVPLWSDGSGKKRWVYLPPGEPIDVSDPAEWVFPLGTKFFKEFAVGDKLVETRLFMKVRKDKWSKATYEWNDDETAATRSTGGDRPDVKVGEPGEEQSYHVPSGSECDQCHGGREDRVLGFELISLGQKGAKGMTLEKLIAEKRLSETPEMEEIEVGDDGTGRGDEALAWLHINCGVSCHNDSENSEAYASGLRLKLKPELLDGRSSADFDILRSTVGVTARTPRWNSQVRIVAGSPEESLLFQLASVRKNGKNNQMPPIATRIVPTDSVEVLADWIRKMDPDRMPVTGPN